MTSNATVRYIGKIPKTLRTYCDAHAHQIAEVDSGPGYAFDERDGFAYDVFLRAGWSMCDDAVHTIIEPTVARTLEQLRAVARCDCDSCIERGAPAKVTP